MTAPTEIYGTTQTVSTTERSLPLNAAYAIGTPVTTPVFMSAFISVLAMAAGDSFRFRIYEKALTGSTQIGYPPTFFLNWPETTLLLPGLALIHGWDITALKITGTDRVIEFSGRGYS